jgi:hypothetical protein
MTKAKLPDRATRVERAQARMSRARAAVKPGSRSQDAQTGHARTLALPELSSMVDEADRDERAMTVSEAADLLECSQQNLNQRILAGALPAYRGPDGRRWVLIDDLLSTHAARAQAEQLHIEQMSRALHDHPTPRWMLPADAPACAEWCTVCEQARAAETSPAPAEEPVDG